MMNLGMFKISHIGVPEKAFTDDNIIFRNNNEILND